MQGYGGTQGHFGTMGRRLEAWGLNPQPYFGSRVALSWMIVGHQLLLSFFTMFKANKEFNEYASANNIPKRNSLSLQIVSLVLSRDWRMGYRGLLHGTMCGILQGITGR